MSSVLFWYYPHSFVLSLFGFWFGLKKFIFFDSRQPDLLGWLIRWVDYSPKKVVFPLRRDSAEIAFFFKGSPSLEPFPELFFAARELVSR